METAFRHEASAREMHEAFTRLDHSLADGRITVEEYSRRIDAVEDYLRARGIVFGPRGNGTLRQSWLNRPR